MKTKQLTENEARLAIKQAMWRDGMKAKDLAKRLDVSPSYICQVLQLDGKPISDRICDVFGLERVQQVIFVQAGQRSSTWTGLKAKEQQS